MQITHIVVQNPAFFYPGRNSSNDLDRNFDPNGLAHGHFKEVRVQHDTAHGVNLIIAQKRRAVWIGLCAGNGQRNQGRAACMGLQNLDQLVRVNSEHETLALSIEHCRNFTRSPHGPRGTFAGLLPYRRC
jgi:hypothetical protein